MLKKWTNILPVLVFSCCSIASAQDGQVITLESGEQVRYFREEQLRELIIRIENGNRCAEELEIIESQLENFESLTNSYQDTVESQELYINSLELENRSLQESLENAIRVSERRGRFLFCDNKFCTYSVGVLTGVAVGAVTATVVVR